MNFIQFYKKFPTQNAVIEYYLEVRYKDGLYCHHCGTLKKSISKTKKPKIFQCNNCNNSFSPFKGTIFENTWTDLRIWFYAIFSILNSKKGFSALQLQRETGISYPTALRILRQIRKAMGNKDQKIFKDTIIEMDETYIGSNSKKSESNEVTKRGRGTEKNAVVGIYDRINNQYHVKIAKFDEEKGTRLSGKQLLDILQERALNDKSNLIMTDEFVSYLTIEKAGFDRYQINHQKEYSNGFIHVNNLESFWGLLKRGIYGIYHHVSAKYLQNYIDEFVFRQENKDNISIFNKLLSQSIII